MKATILVDNTNGENLRGEHGLSIFIEHNGKRILLDTGSSELFLENAILLGIDLSKLDAAVLSHGHYDHSTGTEALFRRNPTVRMAVRREAFEEHYRLKERQFSYNGVPQNLWEDYGNRFIFTEEKPTEQMPEENRSTDETAQMPTETRETDNRNMLARKFALLPGVWLLSHGTTPEHLAAMRKIGSQNGLYTICRNPLPDGSAVESFLPDDFRHEQTLVVECTEESTAGDLIIFNSCSHTGVDVIVHEVQEAFPNRKIRAYIGGFHMVNMTIEEAEETARKLAELPVEKYYTGHCTGERAFGVLQSILRERVEGIYTGMVMKI